MTLDALRENVALLEKRHEVALDEEVDDLIDSIQKGLAGVQLESEENRDIEVLLERVTRKRLIKNERDY